MIENQQSWAFKSKEPKVAIYKDEEKRIRLLYGSRQNLKYKIKLNDQILEPGETKDSPTFKGKLSLGSQIDPNTQMKTIVRKRQDKKARNDIFDTANKLELGPGDYEPSKSLTTKKAPIINFKGTEAKELNPAEKL